MTTEIADLTREDYELFRRLVYDTSGINLGDKKMQLVRARLGKRIRQGNFNSFREYYRQVEQDTTGQELCQLLDAISTNTTHLFREMRHFELLRKFISQRLNNKTWLAQNSQLRIWSAGCSSGEEPHSIAMLAHDALKSHPSIELKILATDISLKMLNRAQLGIYETHKVGTVPPEYQNRYLHKVEYEGAPCLQLAPELMEKIKFARFNLMSDTFPFRHRFDFIFCRNVMIYFDRPTQEVLVNKFAKHLQNTGYLMIGHSESLNGLQHPLTYIEPTVYRN